MPLVRQTLVNGLREVMDSDYPGFTGFPATNIEMAERWSTIVNNYASQVIPVSLTSVAAKTAFNTAMLPISSQIGNGFTQLTAAFTAYAVALIPGMLPGFTGTPPPTPILLTSITPIGLGGASGYVVAEAMATIIHAWFKTGLAVNTATSATINWN